MSPAAFTPDRFAGRSAIVTGAGSGIGLATAVRLALEGATVVAADISPERLAALVAEHPDLALTPVAGDLSNQEAVDRVVAAAGGRVDALANVAGLMDAFLPPAEMDDATWDRVFAIMPPVARPEELAAAITWLLSDDASNVNGVILPCDGGWSAI